MSRLVVRLLGHPSIEFDGVRMPLPSPQRCLSILAVLAMHGNDAMARSSLAAAVWPDELDTDARANLRRHLHALQRWLPAIDGVEWFEADPRTVRWNRDAPAWFDVVAFEQLASDPESIEEAVELYRGDLLEASFDEFLFADRERLRTTYLDACFESAIRARRDRRLRDGIAFTERILAVDEWREDALRLAMTLQHEAGDRSSALTAFDAFSKRLSEQIGVAPMPETIALRDALLTNAPVGARTSSQRDVQAAPAAATTPFVGRKNERNVLEAAWRHAAAGRGTVVFVGGEPGIGKTRLVSEFASVVAMQGGRTLLGETSNPQAYPYEPIVDALRRALPMVLEAPPDEPWLGVLAEILPELHAAFPDVPAPRQLDAAEAHSRLLEAIARTIERLARARPLLLVLEDVHWAQAATLHALEAVGSRIGGVPAVIVATYRSGELAAGNLTALRRRLQLQRLATSVELHSLEDRDVAELVRKTAGVTDDDGGLSASIYACSEGNPLFAALLLRTYAEKGALPAAGVAPPGIAQIVLARTAGLDAAARTTLETAAVAGRSFTSGDLADALGWKESDVLDALGTLLDRGLVRTAGSSAFSYAFTHALIEASMYSSIDSKERAVRHRRIATVLSAAAGERRQALPSIARHWKLAGDASRAAQAYLAAARSALEVHARDEAIDLASEALALEPDPSLRFDVLRVIVDAEEHYAPVERWNDDLTLLAAAAEGLGDEARYAALEARARYYAQTGERERERELIAQMLALADRMRSNDRIVDALGALGNVYVGLGDFRAAVEEFERALALAGALGDRRRTSYVRHRLILTLMRVGDVTAASEQLEIFRAERSGDEPIAERMDMLWAESSVGTAREDPAILERVGNELLELAKTIGDRETEAKARWLLGWAALVAGDAEGVRREYGSAAVLFEQLEQPQSLAATFINLGVHYFEIGLLAQAVDYYERAAACAEQTRARNLVAFALTNIADAELARGNVAKAREFAERGVEAASPTADQRCIAGALSVLGGIECAAGNLDDGIGHLRAAVEIRRTLLNTDSLMEDLCRLADGLADRGDAAAAMETATELETLLATANPRRTPPRFYVTLAKVARLCGNSKRAEELQSRARAIFDAQLAALPDEESRAAFAALPPHRSLGASALGTM